MWSIQGSYGYPLDDYRRRYGRSLFTAQAWWIVNVVDLGSLWIPYGYPMDAQWMTYGYLMSTGVIFGW